MSYGLNLLKGGSVAQLSSCFGFRQVSELLFMLASSGLPIHPKGPKYLYGTKYGVCSSNFPYGLGKYSPNGYLGPFETVCLYLGLMVYGLASRMDINILHDRTYPIPWQFWYRFAGRLCRISGINRCS